MPSTQNSVYRAQKAQKGVFGLKNKKTQNNVRFLFLYLCYCWRINRLRKIRENPLNHQNWTPSAPGLS